MLWEPSYLYCTWPCAHPASITSSQFDGFSTPQPHKITPRSLHGSNATFFTSSSTSTTTNQCTATRFDTTSTASTPRLGCDHHQVP